MSAVAPVRLTMAQLQEVGHRARELAQLRAARKLVTSKEVSVTLDGTATKTSANPLGQHSAQLRVNVSAADIGAELERVIGAEETRLLRLGVVLEDEEA